jgi:glutathione S-transferase
MRNSIEGSDDMKLFYSHNLNPRVAVAVARYLHSPVEFIRASPRHPENERAFRAINPNTLVPVLVEDDRTLWETDAIACRLSGLAKSDFWPTDDRVPELQMWISWGTHHFTKAASAFYWEFVIKPVIGDPSVDIRALDEATDEFHRFAAVLEDVLSNRTWLVGNRLSYADFRVATALPFADAAKLPIGRYPHVIAWHERLCRHSAWSNPFAGLA